MRFGIFCELQLPRPWAGDSELRGEGRHRGEQHEHRQEMKPGAVAKLARSSATDSPRTQITPVIWAADASCGSRTRVSGISAHETEMAG